MARISQETLEEIRKNADIIEIVKEYVPLTQKGKNYFGVCPFHHDHSPSMSVSKEKQLFKCFSCGMAGNVFKFVEEYENISFLEAVSRVAEKIGMSVDIGSEKKSPTKYSEEYKVMSLASMYFENCINTEAGLKAKEYLKERGLTDEIIKDFNIGLSLKDDSMYQFLKQKKITEKELLNLGLINQYGLEYHDVFINRILFPIHNADGLTVGFTGRVYENNKTPKYLNSKETTIFKKGNILFNYHRAKDAVRDKKRLIIVEGNMDAIRMYASGFKNTIALMGTSLTKDQITLIKKLRVPVTLMLDNDDAGYLATMTNGTLLEKEEITVDVVRLSGEKDPDEYIIKNGIKAMEDNIEHAISFLEFRLNYFKKNKNLNDTNELANYVKDVLKTLENKDEITIDITLNKLAREYNLSLDILKSSMKEVEKKEIREIKEKPKKEKKKCYEISAEHILYYMMNDVKYIKMYQSKLGFFKEEIYRGIASEILYYYEEHKQILLADFLNYAEVSPMKEEIYDIIKSIKEEELRDTSMEEYLNNIKENTLKEKVNELKKIQKETSDMLKKEQIGIDITEILKQIQEIRKERSVKK